MPRPPKVIHPICALRRIIKVTQNAFATLIGVSKSYLQKVEGGKVDPTPAHLAETIRAVTGVRRQSLQAGGILLNEAGAPYTRADYLARKRRIESEAYKQECAYFEEQTAHRLAALLEAARSWKRFDLVADEVLVAITEIANRFNIYDLAKRKLAERIPTTANDAGWAGIVPPGKALFCNSKEPKLVPSETTAAEFIAHMKEADSEMWIVVFHSGFTATLEAKASDDMRKFALGNPNEPLESSLKAALLKRRPQP